MESTQYHPVSPDDYNLAGPLWSKYFAETRKNVRFPRGYKEISLFDSES